MEIKKIFLPIVTDKFEETIKFYEKITGKSVILKASHDGYQLSLIEHFVILASLGDPESVKIPSLVNAIFLVDDLEYFWEILENNCRSIIVSLSEVSTGKRFIVEQIDGKIIEYLQLHNS